MTFNLRPQFIGIAALLCSLSGCVVLQQQSSKRSFVDGIYQTKRFSDRKVYVLKIDDDTLAVFPVLEFKDSTAILTSKRINYTSIQRKLRDDKPSHTFYRPSFDVDVMTIPAIYRPSVNGFPNQLNTNFNGALYGGYRIDEYKVSYRRTPLNLYKQSVKHLGYSGGVFAGIGNTSVSALTLDKPAFPFEYEGVLLITGVAANVAAGSLNFGISCGPDFLLDKNRDQWIYQGKLCVGFTFGLNVN